MPAVSTPKARITADEARTREGREAFTLRDGVAVTLLRVDLEAPADVAFFVDSLRGEGAGDARIDWQVYAAADPACQLDNVEPVAEGSGYYTLPEDRTGMVFQVSGVVATSFYLVATLSKSVPVSVKASALAARTLGNQGITAGAMIG